MQSTGPDLRESLILLPLSTRLFTLFFLGVVSYTLYRSAQIMLSLRSLKRQQIDKDATAAMKQISSLSNRAANLRQLHTFTILFFGISIVLHVYSALHPLELWAKSYEAYVVDDLSIYLRYDMVVLLLLLMLHSLQWVVSGRVNAYSSKLSR
jgi:hypothetical protein